MPAPPLLLLVERHFLADCCAGRSKRYLASFPAAVRLWASDLRQPPTTDDLTADAIAQFLRHLRHAGHGPERLREHRNRLHTLWHYAYRRGLASPPATVRIETTQRAVSLPSAAKRSVPNEKFCIFATPAEPDTIRGYFQNVYAPQQLIDKSREHVRAHGDALRSLYKHFGDLALELHTDAKASEHFHWMKDAGRSNWAINNIRKYWFAIWRHAAEAGRIAQHPTIRALKVHRGAPDAWTIAEMKQLLAAASPWWRALLLVGYWTLQRRRALLAIPVDNVDLAGGWIDFPPEAIKTGVGIHCRIGPDAVAAIRALPSTPGPYLFTWTRQLSDIHTEFRALLKRAAVRPSLRKNGQFHKLRRTGATHAVVQGGMAVVCDLLGQSSIYVTKRYIDKTQLPGHDVTRLLPLLMEDSPIDERPEP